MSSDAGFITSVLSIILIDLTLAGDNAVVIALAARRLPRESRRRAIFLGAGAAVVVRVVLTFFVSQVLTVQLIKLVGGLVILWVGMKLFGASPSEHHAGHEAGSVREAVKIIVVADLTMGIDNMLAVGGASEGNLGLLLFGLGFSIPFLILTSDFLSRLMDRYPIIVYVGAAVLGRVAGNMIMTDPTTAALLHPGKAAVYAVEAALAAGVVTAGWFLQRRSRRRAEMVDGVPPVAPEAHAEVAPGQAPGDAAVTPAGSETAGNGHDRDAVPVSPRARARKEPAGGGSGPRTTH